MKEIDAGILQVTPKAEYYTSSAKKVEAAKSDVNYFFNNYDYLITRLSMLLPGTGFAKGLMAHHLLSNPVNKDNLTGLIPYGLDTDLDEKIILYNLSKERTPRALRNLLMLTGLTDKETNSEILKKVNNARTKRIILKYVFDRSSDSLENLALNYKNKVAKLVRHALGQDHGQIMKGNLEAFKKKIFKHNMKALPIFYFLYNKPYKVINLMYPCPRIEEYKNLRDAARKGKVDEFISILKTEIGSTLPYETVLGLRNFYKMDVDIKDIMESTKMTDRQKLQKQRSAAKEGAEIKVDYSKQDLYDLYKFSYSKLMDNNLEGFDKLNQALIQKVKDLKKFSIGDNVAIIFDASASMIGSDERKLHPFITALCIADSIEGEKEFIAVGGIRDPKYGVLIPHGKTDLWKALVKAIEGGSKTIVLISDGYENSIDGAFQHVYDHYKKNSNVEFNLIHFNPVLAANSKTGTVRRIVSDVKPLPMVDYKMLETNIVFDRMLADPEGVKKILIDKYQKLIGM